MRMPPGWDGLKTIEEIWKVDQAIQIVICTTYSDRSWKEIQDSLTERERWMVVKKPFDQIEVLQLAHSLTSKWDLKKAADLREDALELIVASRTEQLTAALQTNSDFLNHVSHEMLTPMNGIIGYLDLLSEPYTEEEGKEYIAEAHGCSEDLLRLIHQVLAYNEAGSDELRPQTAVVDLRAWIPGLVDEVLMKKLAEKSLDFNVNVDHAIQTLYHLSTNIIGKVMSILLGNAVKFTQLGSVEVIVTPSDQDSSDLLFKITDTGVGLSEEQIKLVDIPFTQIDGSFARTNDGIGIGLPLARRLLSIIGSHLEFEPRPGGGTCASFEVTAVVGAQINQTKDEIYVG
jgi:signal transduction histidine kinase